MQDASTVCVCVCGVRGGARHEREGQKVGGVVGVVGRRRRGGGGGVGNTSTNRRSSSSSDHLWR